jgi:hypothetical protein
MPFYILFLQVQSARAGKVMKPSLQHIRIRLPEKNRESACVVALISDGIFLASILQTSVRTTSKDIRQFEALGLHE